MGVFLGWGVCLGISEPAVRALVILLWDLQGGNWVAHVLVDNAVGSLSELEGDAYQALGVSLMRLHELAKAIAFGDESTLLDEMSEQSKFLQGGKSEFLGHE